MKYKHAMEIIENWEIKDVVREYRGGNWCRPLCSDVGCYHLSTLNDPNTFKIQREPRRVWVNIHKCGTITYHLSKLDAVVEAESPHSEESAVEFVEVIK